MITLTRLNGDDIIVHAAQIESLEAGVDTRVTLINGKQLYVQQSLDDVRALVLDWYQSVSSGAPRVAGGNS